MSLLSKLSGAVSSPVAQKLEKALGAGVEASVEQLTQGKPAGSLKGDVLEAAKSGAEASLQKLFGPTVDLPAQLPAYDALSPTALSAAEARSPGLTSPQTCIQSPDGHLHEPVTLTVAGTQAQLSAALQQAGWVEAKPDTTANGIRSALSLVSSQPGISNRVSISDPGGPMSTMLLDGKPQVMAFEKNDDQHRGRDHLRVFATGQTNAAGQPIWAIAATRDTSFKINTATLSACHTIDPNIDRERDQVMADLLGTGAVSSWSVAQGEPTGADAAAIKRQFVTDGRMFEVTLAKT